MEINSEFKNTYVKDLNNEIQEKVQFELQHSLSTRMTNQKEIHQIIINAGHYKICDLENELNIMYV